jgi:hypothetical protein
MDYGDGRFQGQEMVDASAHWKEFRSWSKLLQFRHLLAQDFERDVNIQKEQVC